VVPVPAFGAPGTVGATPREWDTCATGKSAPPDTDDADVRNLLIDEIGDTDTRWQLILEQLDAGDDLATRPRRSVGHPGKQFLGDRSAIVWREGVEVRLGRVGQEGGDTQRRRSLS